MDSLLREATCLQKATLVAFGILRVRFYFGKEVSTNQERSIGDLRVFFSNNSISYTLKVLSKIFVFVVLNGSAPIDVFFRN